MMSMYSNRYRSAVRRYRSYLNDSLSFSVSFNRVVERDGANLLERCSNTEAKHPRGDFLYLHIVGSIMVG